jgi:uncharacterized protein (DUF4415 family)
MTKTRSKLSEGLKNSKTDWDKLDRMSDDDIDCSDIPELDDDFWADAKIIAPPEKQQLTIRLDSDVLDWIKGQGKGYQTRINGILRTYYEAQTGQRNNIEP